MSLNFTSQTVEVLTSAVTVGLNTQQLVSKSYKLYFI